ncbi:MAG: lamin tail domain-containing protein [Candidatus Cloacimonetes bacterium]|nr:lamin tail domain-containing protein [Candidatus Cloacimonadota bacterium]
MEHNAFAGVFALKRRCGILLILALLAAPLCGKVVINELYYDHPGVDTGFEWIELYNAGTVDVNLEGASIQKMGAECVTVFTLPRYLLRAGRYLVIGEAQVPNAHFYASLAFYNGGSGTNGVRLVFPDESNTDTVLYSSPNINHLLDDSGTVASSFALNVTPGQSLARKANGWDTDICGVDWIAEEAPTPNLPNPLRLDYGVFEPLVWQEAGAWHCGLWLRNLSGIEAPLEAAVTFAVDANNAGELRITNIPAADSLYLQYPLPINDDADHLVEIYLDLRDDPVQSNNYLSLWLSGANYISPRINEIMYLPASGNQEWIEIWHPNNTGGSYSIMDKANNNFSFQLPSQAGYYVLCRDVAQLLTRYPLCPPEAIIGVSGWTPLNNDGDALWLMDSSGAVVDSVEYRKNATPVDKSLERFDVDGSPRWRASLAEEGATPGKINSSPAQIPEEQSQPVAVYGSPCKARDGEEITIAWQFPEHDYKISCKVFTRSGSLVRVLANNTLFPNTGMLTWDGRGQSGGYVSRGLYYIKWESRRSDGSKVMHRLFSVAVRD